MRKIAIFIGILLTIIIGVVIYFFIDFINATSQQKGLSSRAKEFLEEQKTQNNSLSNVRLDAKSKIQQDIRIEKCFSLYVPFSIRNINTDNLNPCYRYVSFQDPRGSVVIYKEKAMGLSLEHAPGVSLRRLKKDTYKEESIVTIGNTFLVFKDSTKPYEKTAYLLKSDFYIITTLSVTDPEVSDEKFKILLSSIKNL